jgi:hypothetical protein
MDLTGKQSGIILKKHGDFLEYDDSDNPAMMERIYIPANTTVRVSAEVKLAPGFSGTYPYLGAMDLISGMVKIVLETLVVLIVHNGQVKDIRHSSLRLRHRHMKKSKLQLLPNLIQEII